MNDSSIKWVKFLVIGLLVLGLILRFTNLELRPYWYDETYTSLQISGYNDPQIKQELNGKIVSIETLQKYQFPNAEKSVLDTVHLIAEKEPQLTPLYFILVRFWIQWFGNSIAVTRSFSAVASAITILCAYWFCIELFKSTATAWIAVSLLAISPFHLLYAQEARPPSLWALTVFLSHIALLRAIRLQTPVSWIIYALTGIITLYTYLFSLLVLAGHGIYLLLNSQFRTKRTVIYFIVSSVFAFSSFIPWLYLLLTNVSKANQGNSPAILHIPFLYAVRWIRNIGLMFADFSIGESSPKVFLLPYLVILLMSTMLVIYAVYFLWRSTSKTVYLFLLTAIATPVLPLIIKDLVSGGGASMIGRYLVPSFLGIQIAVAHLFSSKLNSVKIQQFYWRFFWKGAIVAIFSIGLVSCLLMNKSELWWNKADANIDRQLATQVINSEQKPLLVSDCYFAFALSISHSLKPQVRFLLAHENTIPHLPESDDNYQIFLYKPSPIMLEGIQRKYILEPVKIDNPYNPGKTSNEQSLWKVTKRV